MAHGTAKKIAIVHLLLDIGSRDLISLHHENIKYIFFATFINYTEVNMVYICLTTQTLLICIIIYIYIIYIYIINIYIIYKYGFFSVCIYIYIHIYIYIYIYIYILCYILFS